MPGLAVALLVGVAHLSFPFTEPKWTRWLGIVLFTVFGAYLLFARDPGSNEMRPGFARAAGVTFLFLAAYSAYTQVTQS